MLARILAMTCLALLAACATAQGPAGAAQMYESAKAHAAAGNNAKALEVLEAAAVAGFRGLRQLQADSELAGLRNDERYAAVLKTVRRTVFPCETSAKHREFDFWVGTWDVYVGDETKAGENRISVVENGCMLEERWTSASGGGGRSINYYDPGADHWVQQWIDRSGSLINIAGGMQDGSMVLTGTIYYTGTAQKADFRGTWTLLGDGRVRQFFEQSNDAGETWAPWFEGFYVKRAED